MEFISVRTRPTGMLRNGAAPRKAPTISYGTGTLSNPLVVRYTCTHVSLVVPPTVANIFPVS